MHMERKNLWKLGENKAKFLSSRGSNKRKRSKGQMKSSRKSAKVLKKKQADQLSVIEKSSSQKPNVNFLRKSILSRKRSVRSMKRTKSSLKGIYCPMSYNSRNFFLNAKDTGLILSNVKVAAFFERLLIKYITIRAYMRRYDLRA